ncbi:alanine acetyltransferase [Flavobacterium noncentrifugens]|uniref:Ribosomal-protein-alanine N-acetyltransferase n=1 Tax=Flavobacterium noncentrifugens TaxID=1128970 RepID=A0A1G8WFK6_9FLAO|nr:GNAT family N-acetyltransferase [Flavobacterium noncentrifugens]GEP50886.1 alanine acetyltransferase [Flavobacterium noncentrifugens]SDJ76495.1 ribosomal-protein-alanine N-acetyltransferase [Flavobacterium noncentrifugens]
MLEINFSPFPNLETHRLLLRRVESNDVNEIFAIRSDAETMKYIPRPLVENIQEAQSHIDMINDKIENNEGINWAITVKSNPKLIGIIGHYRIKPEHYRAEIGYMLHPDFHGKGYITEAIEKVVAFGFNEMKLHSIEAIIDPENCASAKVLEKNGFVKEAHLRENEYYNGKFLDTVIYSILESDFKK